MEKIIKTYAEEIKNINEEEKSVVGIISSKTIDRDNDIISPEMIDDTNYSKNPIVLWNHNYDKPIGKSLWRKVEGDNYISKTKFGNSQLAQEVFSLVKDKILNAFSIGFMATEEPEYDKEYRKFKKIELLEYSIVSVPANPAAITLDFVKSLQSDELVGIYFKEYIIANIQSDIEKLNRNFNKLKMELKKEIDDIIAACAPVVETKKEAQITADEVKKLLEKRLKIKL